jgi:hypothetical protein
MVPQRSSACFDLSVCRQPIYLSLSYRSDWAGQSDYLRFFSPPRPLPFFVDSLESELLLLTSTMPTTPGLTKLPGVLEEKDGVMQSVNGFLTAEQLDQPSVGQVLESLKLLRRREDDDSIQLF